MLQFYFDKLINVGDPQAYFRKNQQVGRSEQTITISPNELYRLVTFVSSKLDDVVRVYPPCCVRVRVRCLMCLVFFSSSSSSSSSSGHGRGGW